MFRIKQEKKGWVVEFKQTKDYCLFKTHKWIPYIKTSGMDCCWQHSSVDNALDNLLSKVKKEVDIIYKPLDLTIEQLFEDLKENAYDSNNHTYNVKLVDLIVRDRFESLINKD